MANGDLYQRDMGENVGSTVRFRDDGSTHQTVYDQDGGGRYSFDRNPDGSLRGDPHFTDQDYPKGNPDRHPFGR